MTNGPFLDEDGFSHDDLEKVKSRTFNAELKGLIDKISVKTHDAQSSQSFPSAAKTAGEDFTKEEDSPVSEEESSRFILSMHSLFYRALNTLYADINFTAGRTSAVDKIFFYDDSAGCYFRKNPDGDERLHLNSSAFRSIKKNGFAVFESSSVSSGIGGTYVSLPGYFSVQASLSPDSLYRFFPPLARESDVSGIIFSDISFGLSSEDGCRFARRSNILLDLSKLYGLTYLASSRDHSVESLYLLRRMGKKIQKEIPSSHFHILGSNAMLVMIFHEDDDLLFKLMSDDLFSLERVRRAGDAILKYFQ